MRNRLRLLSSAENTTLKQSVRLVDPKEMSRISRDVCNEICEINKVIGFHVRHDRQANILKLILSPV